MKLAYFPNLQMHIVWLELEALPTFTGDLRQRPLKLYLIILLQCIRVRITRCDPCRVHLNSRLQDYWEDDGGQHTVDDNIYILYLSLSVYHIYEHIYLSSRWATDTGFWCRAPPRTRSCSRSGTPYQTLSASRGWRSDSPPSATSWVGPEVNTVSLLLWTCYQPATTTWPWCTPTWTGRQRRSWPICSRWRCSGRPSRTTCW